VFRIRVTKKEVDEYDIEFPWDMTEERAGDILRSSILNGEFTRNNFQDVGYIDDVAVNVVAHNSVETEWSVWNRGQIGNTTESPW
jgi:hypothetical protein